MKRIAIIGGGPIGLEAALYGCIAGLDVDVYETGRVAANVRDWGHVRLFSPFGMNASTWGRAALAEHQPGQQLPADGEYLTGREYAELYLEPLSRLPILRDSIHEQTTVQGISRSHLWKGDLIGRAERGDDPFRLLLKNADGQETDAAADVVLDCSGVYPHHNWLGAGGLPAIGELSAQGNITYGLPDIPGADRADYVGGTTLIVGSGYSAATAVTSLVQLAEERTDTRVIWLTRSDRTPPMATIEHDPLPERRELTTRANRLAQAADSPITFMPRSIVAAIETRGGQGGFRVEIRGGAGRQTLTVDRIIANVGYRPDRSLYAELQMHECYATSGPIKLAAALLGETSLDCLNQTSAGPETLGNPEPGFFVLGAKSYGRDSRFLIRVGLAQIVDVYSMIAADGKPPAARVREQGAQTQQ